MDLSTATLKSTKKMWIMDIIRKTKVIVISVKINVTKTQIVVELNVAVGFGTVAGGHLGDVLQVLKST